jgi:Tfp pilus assembly ATPase PilU
MQMHKNTGMRILDQDLADLVKRRIVTEKEAMLKTSNRASLTRF